MTAIGSPADAPANSSREREAVVALPKCAVPEEEHKKKWNDQQSIDTTKTKADLHKQVDGLFLLAKERE